MATFVWLNEIGDGPKRLVNFDHVVATYPQDGYTSLTLPDGKSIGVRESQEQIAVLLGWHGTQPPKVSG